MKKGSSKRAEPELASDDMLPEYDFAKMKGGVRGKYYRAFRQGYSVTIHKADGTIEVQHFKPEDGAVVLDRDVREYFPNAEAVNRALRALIALIPQKPRKTRAKPRRP
jgi:hypothetical protein